ncbi:MAG: SpoIIIAC/SpoIIIAD family protein [Agathobacter sp.]|nr:SpoIIIAC/SpoIIIAD family protein [Agathobacter sp.]
MWKIGIIGIGASFIALILKKEKQEFSMLVALSASLLIFIYALVKVEYAVNFINEILEKMPIPKKYFYQLLKMLGITYAADFSSNICKDAGYQTIAMEIELFAKISIVILSIPGIELFMDVLGEFI